MTELSHPQASLKPEILELFFKSVSEGNVSEAQSIVDAAYIYDHPSEWSLGYSTALQGMVQALKADGKIHPLLRRLNVGDVEGVELLSRNFASRVSSFLSSDFDKGYFTAWALYMASLATSQKRDS